MKQIRLSEIMVVCKTVLPGAAAILTFAATMTGCVKDELHDTLHPDHGKAAVTVDWANRGGGIAVPESWTVCIGNYTGEETGAVHAPDYLFEPGDYRITVYNPAKDITVSGTTATVTYADAADRQAVASGVRPKGRISRLAKVQEPEFVGVNVDSRNEHNADIILSGTPGWLFTSVQNVTIKKDCDHEFTAAMKQQIRELTLVIEPKGDAKERIIAITGTLSGAAGLLDFATDIHDKPSNISLTFKKITEGTDAGKWTATVRLLGIAGTKQTLRGIITFEGSNPADMPLESDLTASLKDFNGDKTTPLTLGGTLTKTPTEGGFATTITGWKEADAGGVDAY